MTQQHRMDIMSMPLVHITNKITESTRENEYFFFVRYLYTIFIKF